MKKFIMFLILFNIELYSQNFDVDTLHFIWGITNVPRAFDITDQEFTQKSILMGFHWSGYDSYQNHT